MVSDFAVRPPAASGAVLRGCYCVGLLCYDRPVLSCVPCVPCWVSFVVLSKACVAFVVLVSPVASSGACVLWCVCVVVLRSFCCV